ncbi:hypothetical protein BR93DRAFT_922408 [Coniochaeta sp. PMI_546]|nr:hypothetical protein BR93DRAFT_922408 [Coniochaeta sp. PMI_546]
MPPDFESQSYWHDRFSKETAFEWLTDPSTFLRILEPFLGQLDRSAKLLHLGCGTSDLHNHLRARGYYNVTNVDFEPLALNRGQELEQSAFGDLTMKYVLADATQLRLNEKYDLVIDNVQPTRYHVALTVPCYTLPSVSRSTWHRAAAGFRRVTPRPGPRSRSYRSMSTHLLPFLCPSRKKPTPTHSTGATFFSHDR